MEVPSASATTPVPGDEQDLTGTLLQLLGEERLVEARALLARLDPHSPLLARFATVLGPSRAFAREQASGQSLSQQVMALSGDLSAYRGQWAALRDGQIIDADPERAVLRQRLKEVGRLAGSLFVRL